MAGPVPTLYDVLEVGPSATQDEIRQAYITKLKRVHPDVSDSRYADNLTKQVNAAYEVLADSARRANYDRELANRGNPTGRSYQQSRQEQRQGPPPPPPRPEPTKDERRNARKTYKDVDRTALLAWLGVSAALGGMFGYSAGFRYAQPIMDGFLGFMGLVTFLAVAYVALSRWRRKWEPHLMSWLKSLAWSMRPLVGSLRKTLIWIAGVVAAGLLAGCALGFGIGYVTAQFVYDVFASVGTLALIGALVAGAVLLLLAFIRGMKTDTDDQTYYRP